MTNACFKKFLLLGVAGGVLLQGAGCLVTALQFIIQDLASVALSQFLADVIAQATGSAG